ncbi:IPT/TIG domain-containing protein [Chitinophaga sp. MM2321]|uniref:IPT/TIG domain-containing protein n=1 Tax=Chitinophaga sp. MM2321 TaxID=3137178 RepID=UPI0032D57490
MKKYTYLLVLLLGMGACKKEAVNSNGKDPYQETVVPAISINKDGISPGKGSVNDEVTIAGKGFEANKDKLSILFNNVKATVLSLTDTTIRVKIPAMAATGNVSAQVDQQYFFGPFFRVEGTFEMDTLYPGSRGANGAIYDIVPVENDKYLIVGDFTNYDNANIDGGVNRVARINHDGTLDGSFTYGKNKGSNSFVSTAIALPDGRYLVAGGFSSYEGTGYVSSIARLYNNGSLETNKIILPVSQKEQTVSVLRGGVSGQVGALHLQPDNKIIAVGAFRYYVQPDFNLKTVDGTLDSVHLDSIMVNNMVRLDADGGIDSTFNYDLVNHRGREGANGSINRSLLLPDGKLLIAGNFTKYNGQPVNRLARLNTDGSLDPSFNPGSGADQPIYNFERQPDGKYLIVGAFNNYNGQKTPHIVRINEDGAIDPSFKVTKGADGNVFAIGIMPGGEIVLSGTFKQFDDLSRNNFIVLKSDGSVHPGYNTNGGISLGENAVRGGINRFVQQPAEKSMLAVGSFTRYDFRTSNRIVRITYK